MSDNNGVFQTKGEQAIKEFERKLFGDSHLFTGFNDLNKAMCPWLAEREELNLGNLSDKQLAAEVDTLNSYLRDEREMYGRTSHFFNILDAAQQRIRFLSVRLEQALGKEVHDPKQNIQTLGRLQQLPTGGGEGDISENPAFGNHILSPLAEKFHEIVTSRNREEFVEKGVEVRVIPDHPLGHKPAEFICADGAGIETAPSVEVSTIFGADFVGDHEFISIDLPKTQPTPGDLLTVPGVPEGRAILGNESVMVSQGFGITWFEFASAANERASSISRIDTLVSRACFRFELRRSDKLSVLVNKILKKHPEVSDKLILDCFEVANPAMLSASNERLVHMWNNWLDLIKIIDARPLPENEG